MGRGGETRGPWDQNWEPGQSTQLTASAHVDQKMLYVWATRLKDGAPAVGQK